jgi:hypothetical protein
MGLIRFDGFGGFSFIGIQRINSLVGLIGFAGHTSLTGLIGFAHHHTGLDGLIGLACHTGLVGRISIASPIDFSGISKLIGNISLIGLGFIGLTIIGHISLAGLIGNISFIGLNSLSLINGFSLISLVS